MTVKENLYHQNTGYFSIIRWKIIEHIPLGDNKILEIGCGQGATLIKLKELGKASEVVGLDINKDVLLKNRYKLDNILIGDIESLEIPYSEEYFDIIICADILEHLIDPWNTIKKLKKYIKNSGLLIVSIPNIRYIKSIYSIAVMGDFKYSDAGILDKTHLRFFCKRNMEELIHYAGFYILKMIFEIPPKYHLLNKLTLGFFNEFFVSQYIFVATVKIKPERQV